MSSEKEMLSRVRNESSAEHLLPPKIETLEKVVVKMASTILKPIPTSRKEGKEGLCGRTIIVSIL